MSTSNQKDFFDNLDITFQECTVYGFRRVKL